MFHKLDRGDEPFVSDTDFYGSSFDEAVDALEHLTGSMNVRRNGHVTPREERRYTITELSEIAEKQVAIAKRAMEAPGTEGAERFQQWSNVLFALRWMRWRGVQDSAEP